MSPKKVTLLVVGGFLALFVVITVFKSVVTVEKGHVGVVMHWGAVQEKPLDPGLHFVMPFKTSVEEMSTKLTTYEVPGAAAASKDLQTVTTTISVQHALVGLMAPAALQNVGGIDAIDVVVVKPAVEESLKAVTATYTAEELVTKRATVKQQVTEAIRHYIDSTLKEKGIQGALHIANVAITDFKFSKEFNDSIEAKVKAEQEALKAKNEKEKRITEAEAEAAERKLRAEAEAYQIEQTSIARAQAIEREAKALRDNPELIQLRATEKWDGKLPVYTGGGAVPFINVDKLGTKAADK